MKRASFVAAGLLCLFLSCSLTTGASAHASIWYVAGDATQSGDGTSWAEAFQTVEEAVNAASKGDELWIKTGTYLISKEIGIDKAIALYGGFAGTELNKGQRKRQAYPTVLDGNLANRILYVTANMRADELTFTRGRVKGTSSVDIASGGAVVIDNARPVLSHCTFHDNRAEGYYDRGGAIYMMDSRPRIYNCLFEKNGAYGSGGAIFAQNSAPFVRNSQFVDNFVSNYHGAGLYSADSSARIENCLFKNNRSWLDGGAIYNQASDDCPYSTPLIVDTVFTGNNAWNGGAVYNMRSSPTIAYCRFLTNTSFHGGAMVNEGVSAKPRITNTLLAKNTAYSVNGNGNGGAMVNIGGAAPYIAASTFADNLTHLQGSAILNVDSSRAVIHDSIFWGNETVYDPEGLVIFSDETSSASLSYSDVEGGYPGAGNIDADPLFADPSNDDFQPLAGSPVIDKGDNMARFLGKRDLAGKRRILDGDKDGIRQVDMGAFEFGKASVSVTNNTLAVSRAGGGTVNSNLPGITCGLVCKENYPPITKVVLSAVPKKGWHFDHWEGDCSGKKPVCILNMGTKRSAKAVFSR